MTRFVAALLIASGGGITARVDERTPGAEGLGPWQPAALPASAHLRGRRERAEGTEAVRRAGREAWQVHQQQQGGGQ